MEKEVRDKKMAHAEAHFSTLSGGLFKFLFFLFSTFFSQFRIGLWCILLFYRIPNLSLKIFVFKVINSQKEFQVIFGTLNLFRQVFWHFVCPSSTCVFFFISLPSYHQFDLSLPSTIHVVHFTLFIISFLKFCSAQHHFYTFSFVLNTSSFYLLRISSSSKTI